MKAVVFLGEGQLELMDYPDPTPAQDEVVLAIMASGMCDTDLHQYRARRAQGANSISLGTSPAALSPPSGRECTGTQICAPKQKVAFGGINGHGCHAPYMKLPAHTSIKMPDNLSCKAGVAVV